MTAGYEVLDASLEANATRDFAIDVLVGLSERPKRIASRYFYDAMGSQLFERITELEDYYITRVERRILEENRERIGAAAGREPFDLIDLGAGDGRKTAVLLEHLAAARADVRYVPIDVSEPAMKDLVARVRERHAGVDVAGLVSEYLTGLDWLAEQTGRRKLVLFLGSNIGNFDGARSRVFLRRLWNALEPDDLVLIGFDLRKDVDVLMRAYDDPSGVTRAFNLNLLTRINRELGGRFDLSTFTHFATYNVLSGGMESYLLSTCRQLVLVEALQREFSFEPWEPIHTEFSFKYLDEDVERLARDTGFEIEARFWDPDHRFCDALWRVVKAASAARP